MDKYTVLIEKVKSKIADLEQEYKDIEIQAENMSKQFYSLDGQINSLNIEQNDLENRLKITHDAPEYLGTQRFNALIYTYFIFLLSLAVKSFINPSFFTPLELITVLALISSATTANYFIIKRRKTKEIKEIKSENIEEKIEKINEQREELLPAYNLSKEIHEELKREMLVIKNRTNDFTDGLDALSKMLGELSEQRKSCEFTDKNSDKLCDSCILKLSLQK